MCIYIYMDIAYVVYIYFVHFSALVYASTTDLPPSSMCFFLLFLNTNAKWDEMWRVCCGDDADEMKHET